MVAPDPPLPSPPKKRAVLSFNSLKYFLSVDSSWAALVDGLAISHLFIVLLFLSPIHSRNKHWAAMREETKANTCRG
ncbi:hypothetical protein OPQ81_005202 [Rhizoctonia solani]|nr:hypothetical protein OPQ81_005202 [Rhizoctonia solani]